MASKEYRCARCHTKFAPKEDEERCPSCGAEAGLEPVKHGLPPAMKLFGALIGGALVATVAGIVMAVTG